MNKINLFISRESSEDTISSLGCGVQDEHFNDLKHHKNSFERVQVGIAASSPQEPDNTEMFSGLHDSGHPL